MSYFDLTNRWRRVRLVSTNDEFTSLGLGALGTVVFESATGELGVNWDSGSRFSLLVGIDKWQLPPTSTALLLSSTDHPPMPPGTMPFLNDLQDISHACCFYSSPGGRVDV